MSVSFATRKLRGLARLLRDRVLLVPATLATIVVPRDPRIWAFGSWHGTRFADNPKHLFLHCHTRPTGVRAVWLSANRDIVAQVRALGLHFE